MDKKRINKTHKSNATLEIIKGTYSIVFFACIIPVILILLILALY